MRERHRAKRETQ